MLTGLAFYCKVNEGKHLTNVRKANWGNHNTKCKKIGGHKVHGTTSKNTSANLQTWIQIFQSGHKQHVVGASVMNLAGQQLWACLVDMQKLLSLP